MALHLFDPPAPPIPSPTLDELLEGFWGGKDPRVWGKHQLGKVWIFRTVDQCEKNRADATSIQVYGSKEAALWAFWVDELDTVSSDPEYFEEGVITPSEWLAKALTQLQNLMDDGCDYSDGDFLYCIEEMEVL